MSDDARGEDDEFANDALLQNPNDTTPESPDALTMAQRWRGWSRERRLTVAIDGKVPRMKIKGKVLNDEIADATIQTRYVAFRGIPYATPPVDELRFQPTQPLRLHTSLFGTVVWKAYEDKQPCLQRDSRDIAHGSEDCLYLNVYLPREPQKIIGNLLPVLVYFHGGAFLSGTGDHQHVTPDSMMKHDLVFVTVNYRIGPIGFLNMQTQSCRGNMGLKDQTQALRWIRDNIKRFKGDPGNVTISGHGAGATCVNFHLISPLSQGLFHKAIVSAGGIFCPWGFKGHRREFKELIRQASGENIEIEETREEDTLEYKARKVVTEYFMRKSAEDFLKAAMEIMDDYTEDAEPTQLTAYLGPSVEIRGEHTFINDTVPNMMAAAKPVPILAGIAKNEGNQVYIGQSTRTLVQLVKQDRQFRSFLEQHFQWTFSEAADKMHAIRELYFGKNFLTLNDRQIEEGLVNLHTDISHRRFYENFQFGENKQFPQLHVYEFDYYNKLNEVWHDELQDNPRGDNIAGHGDELLYLYCPSKIRERLKPFDQEVEHVINNMCSLWANFCKNGTPKSDYEDVEWRPHTKEQPCHLHIGKTLTLKEGSLNADRWAALTRIIQNEPLLKSLQETPVTPEPPSILAPYWSDPELTNVFDKWIPTRDVRRGSRASVLTKRSSSRKTSQRSSISSTRFVSEMGDAPSSLSAAVSRFRLFGGGKQYTRVGASSSAEQLPQQQQQSRSTPEPRPEPSSSSSGGPIPPPLPPREPLPNISSCSLQEQRLLEQATASPGAVSQQSRAPLVVRGQSQSRPRYVPKFLADLWSQQETNL